MRAGIEGSTVRAGIEGSTVRARIEGSTVRIGIEGFCYKVYMMPLTSHHLHLIFLRKPHQCSFSRYIFYSGTD